MSFLWTKFHLVILTREGNNIVPNLQSFLLFSAPDYNKNVFLLAMRFNNVSDWVQSF